MKELSIIITTYNRKERLFDQLRSIFRQSNYLQVELIILDNNSDYDLLTMLNLSFSKEELSIVEVIKRPYNIGMVGNLSTSFMYCKTKWMWLLSDDDETTLSSIEIILNNIHNNKEIAIFKYSIKNFYPEDFKTISTIDEFIEYYKNGSHTSGNMIFMSNNIFNLELLHPYLGYASIHGYTYIPHIIPIIAGLCSNKIKMAFIPDVIVSFKPPEPGSNWNFIPVILGLSSFGDLDVSMNKKQHNRLCSLVVRDFNHLKFIYDLSLIKKRWKRKYIYTKVFFNLYIHDRNFHWIHFFIFHIIFLFRINVVSLRKKMRWII